VAIWDQTSRVLEECGASLVDVTIPEPKDLSHMYRDVVAYEAFQVHRELLEAYGPQYGSNARIRLEEGRHISERHYRHALDTKRSLGIAIGNLWEDVRLLLLPTQPTVAPRLGSQLTTLNDVETAVLPIRGRFTYLASLTGVPSLSLPAGFSRSGLPVGVQLIGRAFDESTLLSAGHAYQQATDWHLRRPALSSIPPLSTL
jgi:Asp-tRNA(Asn)/Glu-tRNA(Gln) amidotransferase A subunit family amidase